MSVSLRDRARGPRWSSVSVEHPPAPALAEHVVCTWSGRPGRDGWLRVLPDGCVDLSWNGAEVVVTWAGAGPLRIPLARHRPAEGIRLRCGAAPAVLGAVATPGTVPLATLTGARAAGPLERDLRAAGEPSGRCTLLEGWVGDRVAGARPPDPVLGSVLAMLAEPGVTVADVAADHAVAERTLRRVVAERVGLGPKSLARVRRFQRFLGALDDLAAGRRSLADVAADLGYADQSHLGRECRALSGSTPAGLLATWCGTAPGGRKRPDTGDRAAHAAGHDRPG